MALDLSPASRKRWSRNFGIFAAAAFALCLFLTATERMTRFKLAHCEAGEVAGDPTLDKAEADDERGVLRIVYVAGGERGEEQWIGRPVCVVVAGVGVERAQRAHDEAAAKEALDAAEAAMAKAGADADKTKAQAARDEARKRWDAARAKALEALPLVELTPFLDHRKADWAKAKVEATEKAQTVVFDFGSPADPLLAGDAKEKVAGFWRKLLDKGTDDGGGAKTFAFGLGRGNADVPEPGKIVTTVTYRIVSKAPFATGAVAILALAASLVLFASQSTLLRDNSQMSEDNPPTPVGAWSLARVQMAMWTILAFSSFIFFWLTLGQYNDVITGSVLVLLGINSATGLFAVAVLDNNNNSKTKNFFTDILSVNNELQLSRIQLALWTIALGLVFIWNVIHNFTIVKFDDNLLLLLGIAQTTYLGFKWKEPAKS